MIDLHLHTTASDGRSTPETLAAAAAAAGLRTIAVTDHDTMSAVSDVARAAQPFDITVVPGIEITAVHDGRDVHVLGYFLDDANPQFAAFLEAQRADRRRRVLDIGKKLAALGAPVDVEAIVERAPVQGGRAVGRPQIAAALVAAGHAADIADAFERYLAGGRPAYVPRRGASPAEVVMIIKRAGGLSSLAHPGKMGVDGLIPVLKVAGLTAVEAFHPDHDAAQTARYAALAASLDLVVTGGSDYHGPGSGRAERLGEVTLPPAEFARFDAKRSAAR